MEWLVYSRKTDLEIMSGKLGHAEARSRGGQVMQDSICISDMAVGDLINSMYRACVARCLQFATNIGC